MKKVFKKSLKGDDQRKGQVVVEYLLVAVMIVGVGMTAYVAIKTYLPNTLAALKEKIEGDPDPSGLGKSAGTGSKSYREYYQDVEFKSQ